MNHLLPPTTWPIQAEPLIRAAGRFPLRDTDFNQPYLSPTHALHIHDYHGQIEINGRHFDLHPGTATLTPAGQTSRYHLPEPGLHWCIHFVPINPTDELVVELPHATHLGVRQAEAEGRMIDITSLWQRSHDRGNESKQALRFKLAAQLALQEALVWIGMFEPIRQTPSLTPDKVVQQVMQIIDAELAHPLVVPEIAKRVDISQRLLAKRFAAAAGQSITSYILGRRIASAQLLLSTTDLPIKRIAAQVGMPDPHHFNKQFRLLTGQSPSKARKQAR